MDTKTKIYMIILSLVMTLVGMTIMKFSQSASVVGANKSMAAYQRIEALEKSAPNSPEMSKFLQHETAEREAKQEALDQ